jgi:hypothetical protein
MRRTGKGLGDLSRFAQCPGGGGGPLSLQEQPEVLELDV